LSAHLPLDPKDCMTLWMIILLLVIIFWGDICNSSVSNYFYAQIMCISVLHKIYQTQIFYYMWYCVNIL
jgi:hypothetical protein